MKQIENIFSKTKTKTEAICPNPKTPIIIDKRENNSLIKANLIEQKANFQEEILEIGDYLINDTILERKTYKDFTASIIDKRLFNQIHQMKKYPNHFLILEGFDFTYKSSLHPNAIRGAILTIAKQIPIIYTEDESDTVNFLITMAKRQEKIPQEFSTRQTKSKQTLEQQKQFILEGFSEIGPTTAKNLLKEFNTLNKIFNATKSELKKILNEKQIEKLLQLLN
ncbi:MAG: ERCC4 domain-containing protein [archaeon]